VNYSLINVSNEKDGFVDGVWMQDCTGTTLETAIKRARDTEKVNSSRIKVTVAVVESLCCPTPNYSYRTGLKRLDCRQGDGTDAGALT